MISGSVDKWFSGSVIYFNSKNGFLSTETVQDTYESRKQNMKYTYTEKKDTRSGFGAGLAELADKNPNVVALCADLIGSLKMEKFIEKAPERFFQVGIAEANMMGIAAGLTINGKIPFTGTFANFSTSRVYDQIRQSIAYS